MITHVRAITFEQINETSCDRSLVQHDNFRTSVVIRLSSLFAYLLS